MVPWLGGIDQRHQMRSLLLQALAVKFLEQVGSLFWSMTKRGKEKIDRKNYIIEMTESLKIESKRIIRWKHC